MKDWDKEQETEDQDGKIDVASDDDDDGGDDGW